MNQKYNDYLRLDSIDKQQDYFTIYVDNDTLSNDSFLDEISKISQKYDASIIRSDVIEKNNKLITIKAGTFTNTYLTYINNFISKGENIKRDSDVLSTFKGNKNQVGMLYDLFEDDPMIVMTLNNYLQHSNKSIDGSYTICSPTNHKQEIINELSTYLNQDSSLLLQANYQKTYTKGPVEIIIAASIILLLIYALMCCFYPTSQIKEIGVYKLLGFSEFDIWKQLNRKNIMIYIIFVFISLFLQKLLIPGCDLNYLFLLFIYQMIIILFSILISSIMVFITKRYTLNSILKGFFHVKASLLLGYGLKLVTFIAFVFVIPSMASATNLFFKQIATKKAYEDISNTVTLSNFDFVDDEFQQMLNGQSSLDDKLFSMFQELEETANAQYFSFIDMNKDISLLEINKNGLQDYQNWFDESIDSYFNTDKLVLLVPSTYKNDSSIKDIYNQIPTILSDESINLDVHYYKANSNMMFTQTQQMIDNGKAFVSNPIFVCLNDTNIQNQSALFINEASSNPIRIENNKTNQLLLKQAIIDANLQQNNIQFDSILNSGFKDYLSGLQSGLLLTSTRLVLIVLVDILASYYILLILFVTRKKEIFVKKILGYPMLERYKNELFYFLVLYLFGFIELFITKQSVISLLLFALLVFIDLFVLFILIHKQEQKNLNLLLKGEE
ncbi:MAG: DUF1430 domain-containing protein [Erysipelotrichaceae bacterium]|uniref:DUF1430 domain-containing protein n=1 Tax=Floccifex sp. TaxID=2815810 RepID=UPI002A74E498|nr:DUF1430 domain-containing protein [Floccifex sp.]MDD7281943.1 DUF1430 domain-containing protein [Erysipelotrichaceae bacterium]MDY2958308.1 DUF1430 domain-containing protein [Floccifex sp.]